MRRRTVLGGLAAVGLGGGLSALATPTSQGDEGVEALVAGSLQAVAGRVPGATVEAHGSLAVRRLVLEDAREPDVVALADPKLFEGLANTYTLFATNALVLAYDPSAPHVDELRRDWRGALRDATVGRTDPTLDPLGYRTVLAVELDGTLDRSALDGTSVLPETALMRTLEAGGVEAAFAYRSMAVEHGVPYVSLPESIDFSSPALADHYATVSIELADRTVRGAPIRYATAALTAAGRPWAKALTTDDSRLAEAGFVVPAGYPRVTSTSSPV